MRKWGYDPYIWSMTLLITIGAHFGAAKPHFAVKHDHYHCVMSSFWPCCFHQTVTACRVRGRHILSFQFSPITYHSFARFPVTWSVIKGGNYVGLRLTGTLNIDLKMVVSIWWFQIFTMEKWVFHHFHPLRNDRLGFQAVIVTVCNTNYSFVKPTEETLSESRQSPYPSIVRPIRNIKHQPIPSPKL